ncbi:MAG: trypsin-like peptidase domain-containing protein [Vicinamibacterales bacterium]|nr:trypsin-like peptidase domain-containing protein [Vicinamibacterales bacterium]
MVRDANRFLLVLALLVAVASGSTVASPHTGQNSPASIGPTLFRDIAQRQNPAVVSIMARSRSRALDQDEVDVFRLFGVVPSDPGGQVQRVLGSGFLISAAGEILTNNHVIEEADTIEVSLFGNDRKRYHAVLVGRDPVTDSALIRLENPPPDLPAMTLGDSSALRPGDWVMAIGNPFRLGHTVTVGFVSFQGRPFQMQDGRWQDMIQTDVSINPGNSGGPLIDVSGEVVGINVAIFDDETGSNIGIGFAVPINSVKALLPQLRQGKVVRGHLGVRFHDGPILEDEASQLGLPEACGALVMSVDGESAAERAGLRAGDVIVELDGRPVADIRDLVARVSSIAPGTDVKLKVVRDGAEQTRMVKIEELPFESAEVPSAEGEKTEDIDGLTVRELTPPDMNRLSVPPGIDGALVVDVALDSAADDAGLAVGDIIRAINRHPVHTAAKGRNELRRIEPRRPIFLLVWRHGTEVFLQMRKD